jgi:hypothetical protein
MPPEVALESHNGHAIKGRLTAFAPDRDVVQIIPSGQSRPALLRAAQFGVFVVAGDQSADGPAAERGGAQGVFDLLHQAAGGQPGGGPHDDLHARVAAAGHRSGHHPWR